MAGCEEFVDLGVSFANESFVEGLTCTYGEPLGLVTLGLLAWTGIGGAIWIRTGSIAIPAVLALILGNIVLAQVAPEALAVVALVILNALAIGGAVIIWRVAD